MDILGMIVHSSTPNWLYPDQTRGKHEYPYTYSPFFLVGDHESIKSAESVYTDRYKLWNADKFANAIKLAFGIEGREPSWTRYSRAQIDAFIKAYHGEQYSLVGIIEWCNLSTGYPYWSLHFK